ncbi:MAG TPA: hypothetical protein VF627_06550 [Abditibacterium sp.]
MRRDFALSGALLLLLNTTSQAQQNRPRLPLSRLPLIGGNQALPPALVPPPQGAWPQPVEFSYSKPALEAAQWWQGITANGTTGTDIGTDGVGTDGLSAAQVAKSREAAQRFAEGHQNDAPLLLAWQVDGENWRVHLTPAEAVSNRYPPLIQEWGVPKKAASSSDLGLVPLGDPNGMTPDIAYPLIIWHPGNALRWQMLFLLSHSAQRWFPPQRGVDVQFNVQAPDVTPFGNGIVVKSFNSVQRAYLGGDAVYVDSLAVSPIAALGAILKQQTTLRAGKTAGDQQNFFYTGYKTMYWANLNVLINSTQAAPARFSRILATLDERYLTEAPSEQKTAVPSWMTKGLQNIYSLNTANLISDVNHMETWFPPLEPEVQQMWNSMSRRKYVNNAEIVTRHTSLAAAPIDKDPLNGEGELKGIDLDNLEGLDSTSQMRFFFTQYGNGAVTETLQRLGSGQSIDTALHETTGLTEAQFFAVWKNRLDTTDQP